MANTGKCPICGKWHPLEGNGNLANHRHEVLRDVFRKCVGSGAAPLPREPRAPAKKKAAAEVEADPQEQINP